MSITKITPDTKIRVSVMDYAWVPILEEIPTIIADIRSVWIDNIALLESNEVSLFEKKLCKSIKTIMYGLWCAHTALSSVPARIHKRENHTDEEINAAAGSMLENINIEKTQANFEDRIFVGLWESENYVDDSRVVYIPLKEFIPEEAFITV